MITQPQTLTEREQFFMDMFRQQEDDANDSSPTPDASPAIPLPYSDPPALPFPQATDPEPSEYDMTVEPEADESWRQRVLSEALLATTEDRNLNYGDPEDNFDTIAKFWAVYLSRAFASRGALELTAADVAQMMILVKTARLAHTPDHFDSLVDIAGYAACHGGILGSQ